MAPVYMDTISTADDAISYSMQFVDELPVPTQTEISVLAKQPSLFICEMCLWMN